MVSEALKLVMAQGGETPVAAATPTPKPSQVLTPELLRAIVRLHGSGSKVSPWRPEYAALSVDDQAMAMRPRASNYGKDIFLPRESGFGGATQASQDRELMNRSYWERIAEEQARRKGGR